MRFLASFTEEKKSGFPRSIRPTHWQICCSSPWKGRG